MADMKKPNFLIVVADDLGFSDIGPYGGEIKTPTLDKIAKEGVRMTNFHTAPSCSPTRSMLFSGTDNHIAGVGQMAEFMKFKPEAFEGKPGYEGYLNYRVAALSEILQDAGYDTIMSGKWHLGMTREFAPCSRGFNKSFAFLPGAGNHHNFEPQIDLAKGPPPQVGLAEEVWMEGDQFLDRKKDLPKDFYSTKTYTDRMISFLKDRSAEDKDKPFFAYLPLTAPHWPLQAPKNVVAKYRGMYDEGPRKLSQKRVKRLIELGLVPADVEPAPPIGILDPEWHDMTPEERAASARKMEVFAAMVDLIDQNLARLIAYLESTGEFDNTFFLFMSDNGAEGLLLEALPLMGFPGDIGDAIDTYYDNSLENIGERNSFTFYGPRWACAATAPARGFKGIIYEGGIRCPCIVRYPGFGNKESAITHTFTTVMDILPTILDLAGIPSPGNTFRGREVVSVRGKSWVPHLSSRTDSVHGDETHVHGWELFGTCAIRKGNWKAVWIPAPRGKNIWELFNLESDPSESHDCATSHTDILAELVNHWNTYFAETGMVMIPQYAGTRRLLSSSI
ncbi:uncharacterized protein Z518_09952 [Rhinocladiella mackenziei CBS 650.93]|uniref:Sulfatase N-terminal domain-containing protein n=1 Tax=Rhinocladiella mackenziei CBS 650.93 TaxID=1442369 RepID=A0A0D2FFW4_9EURO|nr:uncharacterized protein Z518_09952 [Rhinocladiella mackenziei CBS 650.93]KIX00887.1 hypothetical protein Z518_09952 [Rhinocladiella mackenziei CBS 650.93]